MASGQLIFQPPMFDWPSDDQQTAFKEWQSYITLMLEVSNIAPERWYASIIGFLGTEGFKRWQHLDISKKDDEKKHPENVFKAFTDTLEVLTSPWNYIDEMYSDIRQGEQETTDQLDQRIKILVERCSYMTEQEKQHWLELLFHATKHFEVKKWVRSQTAQKETVTFNKLLQHAKQHEATIKDFQWHKSNGGVAMATTINEIRTVKHRKGQGQRAKGNQGKICSKCGMSHLPRECPAWGKKCHKCGNKNHFSTQCRSKQSGAGNRKSHSTSRGHKGKGKPHCSSSRSKSATKSAYSMESVSFQDHSNDLHGESADLHGNQRGDLHGNNSFQDHLGGTEFLKQSFSTISRLKSVTSISNNTDPEGKIKILTVLQIKLPHCKGIDDITVKVDNGAEGNILPLNSFRAMFPHALDTNGYPKPGFLRGSKTILECYDDGKLINHGSIKLRPALLRKVISRPFFLHCRD